MLVHIEGLLTQLVFEHSLRIRLKAEASNEKTEGNLTVAGMPDSASVAEGTVTDSNPDERASQPSQSSTVVSRDSLTSSKSTSKDRIKGKDKDGLSNLKRNTKQATKEKVEAENLIGKINNLVTTDLGNIVQGVDFLMIGTASMTPVSFEFRFIV